MLEGKNWWQPCNHEELHLSYGHTPLGLHDATDCLCVGVSGMKFLEQSLYPLVTQYSPRELRINLYGHSGVFWDKGIRHNIPHIGCTNAPYDADAFAQIFSGLRQMARERLALFAEAGVYTFEQYAEKHLPHSPLRVVAIIQGVGNEFGRQLSLSRDSLYGTGIHVFLVSTNEPPDSRAFPNRIYFKGNTLDVTIQGFGSKTYEPELLTPDDLNLCRAEFRYLCAEKGV